MTRNTLKYYNGRNRNVAKVCISKNIWIRRQKFNKENYFGLSTTLYKSPNVEANTKHRSSPYIASSLTVSDGLTHGTLLFIQFKSEGTLLVHRYVQQVEAQQLPMH